MVEGNSATYTIRDADPAAAEAMLRFIYTGAAYGEEGGEEGALDPAALLELGVVYAPDWLPLSVTWRSDSM